MSDAREAQQSGAATPTGWIAYLDGVTKRPGWSVARLARESDIHRSSIFRWLSGEVTNVSVNSVKAIARAAGDNEADALRAAGDALTPTATRAKTALGTTLLRRMAMAGMTQLQDLIEAAGVPGQTLRDMIYVEGYQADPATMSAISEALDVDPASWVAPAPSLADEVDLLLSSDGPLADAERQDLEVVLRHLLAPYLSRLERPIEAC